MLLTEYDEELHIRSEREIAKTEGETRINRLNQLLIEQNRMEDLIKATKDPLFQEKLFTELGI